MKNDIVDVKCPNCKSDQIVDTGKHNVFLCEKWESVFHKNEIEKDLKSLEKKK